MFITVILVYQLKNSNYIIVLILQIIRTTPYLYHIRFTRSLLLNPYIVHPYHTYHSLHNPNIMDS